MMNKACMPLNSFLFFVFSADMLVFWASKSQTNTLIQGITLIKQKYNWDQPWSLPQSIYPVWINYTEI